MEKLKKKIKNKYGTLSKFCRLTGIERNHLGRFLNQDKRQDNKPRKGFKEFGEYINYIIEKTPNETELIEITEDDREGLNMHIIKYYNASNRLFANVNNFDYVNVCQVLSGYRKTKTSIVQEILNVIN